MAKYSMKDRKDMSMGTRDYDKGYRAGKAADMKGMPKEMGHDGSVRKIETCNAEQYDMGRMQWKFGNRKGYNAEAWNYQW